MAVLRCGDELVEVEVAATARARLVGLLGRDGFDHALLLRPARSVHSFGMRFAIDVAHLDGSGLVLAVATMAPNRLGRRVRGARSILEAEAGRFTRWGIEPGGRITLVDDAHTPRGMR